MAMTTLMTMTITATTTVMTTITMVTIMVTITTTTATRSKARQAGSNRRGRTGLTAGRLDPIFAAPQRQPTQRGHHGQLSSPYRQHVLARRGRADQSRLGAVHAALASPQGAHHLPV